GAFARPAERSEAHGCTTAMLEFTVISASRQQPRVSKRANPLSHPDSCRNLQLVLDFPAKRISIELSPPIQFRIEWADSQGMSPLLGCRPIYFVDRNY